MCFGNETCEINPFILEQDTFTKCTCLFFIRQWGAHICSHEWRRVQIHRGSLLRCACFCQKHAKRTHMPNSVRINPSLRYPKWSRNKSLPNSSSGASDLDTSSNDMSTSNYYVSVNVQFSSAPKKVDEMPSGPLNVRP